MKRIVVAVALVGCGSDGDPAPLVDYEACRWLQHGPFQTIVASATRDSSAPAIDDDDVAYRVDGAGFVFFGADAAGDHALFVDADVTLEVTDSFGEVVAPVESSASSLACGEIRGRHVYAMDVGVYYVELSGAATVVVEAAGLDRDL